MEWNHFWPQEWMAKPRDYDASSVFVVAEQLRTTMGAGIDSLFDEWMTRRIIGTYFSATDQRRLLKANGDFIAKDPATKEAQRYFKMQLSGPARTAEVERFYKVTYNFKLPDTFGDDGVIGSPKGVTQTLAGTP